MPISASLPSTAPPRQDVVREHAVYETPDLKERRLGAIPIDTWSFTPFGAGYYSRPDGCNDGGDEIWRACPQYEPDHTARLHTVVKDIQARPYSVALFGFLGVVGGGAIAAGIAAAASSLAGWSIPLVAGGAAVVGALAGGVGMARYAAGDRVRIEWSEQPINEKKLVGYWDTVSPHFIERCHTTTDSKGHSHTECHLEQEGWDHHYSADVRYWPVGSYVGPQIVHYQASSGEWKPDPTMGDGDRPLSDPIPQTTTADPPKPPPATPGATGKGSHS